jgi:hypothetical protein
MAGFSTRRLDLQVDFPFTPHAISMAQGAAGLLTAMYEAFSPIIPLVPANLIAAGGNSVGDLAARVLLKGLIVDVSAIALRIRAEELTGWAQGNKVEQICAKAVAVVTEKLPNIKMQTAEVALSIWLQPTAPGTIRDLFNGRASLPVAKEWQDQTITFCPSYRGHNEADGYAWTAHAEPSVLDPEGLFVRFNLRTGNLPPIPVVGEISDLTGKLVDQLFSALGVEIVTE